MIRAGRRYKSIRATVVSTSPVALSLVLEAIHFTPWVVLPEECLLKFFIGLFLVPGPLLQIVDDDLLDSLL